MIRITGGTLRGRSIESPPRSKDIRPTTSLMRESIFNSLQQDIAGSRFLDLFAGSGIMGLEALSRGAAFVLAIEKDPRQAQLIRQNYLKMKLSETHAKIVTADVDRLIGRANREAPFDIVFLDPPYGYAALPQLVGNLQALDWIQPGGRIIAEHGSREADLPGFSRKLYGDSSLSFFTVPVP